jgi:hypothetical protein
MNENPCEERGQSASSSDDEHQKRRHYRQQATSPRGVPMPIRWRMSSPRLKPRHESAGA